MKIALPIITLILCVGFLISQQVSVANLKKENENLGSRITQAEHSGGSTANANGGPAHGKSGSDKRGGSSDGLPVSVAEIDLQELAETMMNAENGGGIPNFKAMFRVQSLILEASAEELENLIKKTGDLDVPDEVKRNLIGEFIGALAEHDPKKALDLAFNTAQLSVDEGRWHISGAFSKWAKKDPAGAVAWFDKENARGTFESKALSGNSHHMTQFHASAIAAIATTNPTGARDRILALPEGDRDNIFTSSQFNDLIRDDPRSFATLVRETVPEDARNRVLAEQTRNLVRGEGFDRVTKYADAIEATPAERQTIAEQAAENKFQRMGWESDTPDLEDVSELQTFLQSQNQEEAGRITGESIAQFGSSNDNFEEALGLVREVHGQNPEDDLIIGFLRSSHPSNDNEAAARDLAALIQDPTNRAEALERIK